VCAPLARRRIKLTFFTHVAGDRYGIAHTLVESLEKAHIKPLALSCIISSISLIIRQHELAVQMILGNTCAALVENDPVATRRRHRLGDSLRPGDPCPVCRETARIQGINRKGLGHKIEQ
jgi:hypothetical protein